jgi:hypothetical protein
MKDEWAVGYQPRERRGSQEEIANRWAVKLARIGTRLEATPPEKTKRERCRDRSLTCRDVRVRSEMEFSSSIGFLRDWIIFKV